MMYIDRAVIQTLLKRWGSGTIDEREVHEEAERLCDQYEEWPTLPERHPESIAIEVLSHLEILNHQLITREDIPVMLAFLDTPLGKELKGWKAWRRYWDGLDFRSRRKVLKHNPYYSTEELHGEYGNNREGS
ncbi:hypothetical protein HYR99_18285 [Candidatus Poribacteria bacterium]|nr:hypothetical protein [Candidatus Poribacteria bacterium]